MIDEQFVDPADVDDEILGSASSITQHKANELSKYLKMLIDDKFTTPNPLPFWQYHEDI